MDPELHRLLLDSDCRGRWERPRRHDRDRELQRVEHLKPELEGLLQLPLEIDHHVEDASFLTDLSSPAEPVPGEQRLFYSPLAIRFSNFNSLVTVYRNSPEPDEFPLAAIQGLLRRHGFTPVPEEALGEEYDGVNAGDDVCKALGRTPTWQWRFFDYL